jgi:hypothetical protein
VNLEIILVQRVAPAVQRYPFVSDIHFTHLSVLKSFRNYQNGTTHAEDKNVI